MAGKGEAAGGALDALAGKGEAAGGAFDAMAAKGAAIDGVAEGAADALDFDGDIDAPGTNLLHAFSLRRAPLTVTFSFIVFIGWVISYCAMKYLAPSSPLSPALTSTLVLLGATFLSLPLTSAATVPLEPIFRQRPAPSRIDYVGTVCRIRTGKVNDEFGQARVDQDGTELIIQVRGEVGALGRGDRALIIDYDAEREAYLVEAYDEILKEGEQARRRN